MFSKMSNWLACAAGAVGLAASVIACTPQIGEQPPEPKNIELTATKCLNQSAEDLKKFFDADVDEAHLKASWTCVESAFLQFEKYVVGKDQDRYTSQEIVTFLETNFFENAQKNKITPELQIELMKLKQIFLGGDTAFVTRDELRRSQAFIEEISRMTVKINPYMKIIVAKWKPNLDTVKSQDLAEFETANSALQEFAVELSGLIVKNVSLYHINDLVTLFKEFEKFFEADWDWVKDVENLIPGCKKLKLALAGGDENTINQKEWNPVLILGSRGYFQFLRYKYFIKSTHETGGAVRLVYVARTLEDVFSIFQDLVSQKVTGVVTAHEVYEILHGFEQFWPELKVSENLINEFMKIKQVLIGGSVETWTAVDFEQARLKVPELRRIIENFMPYFSIYASEWEPDMEDPEEARETFKQARVRLAVVAQDFGHFLRGAYSYDDLIKLVNEINTLYPNSRLFGSRNTQVDKADARALLLEKSKTRTQGSATNPSTGKPAKKVTPKPTPPDSVNGAEAPKNFAEKISQYRDVFLEAKRMIYNEPDTIIQKDQWSEVLPIVAQIFSLYQYNDYFLTDKNWKQTRAVLDIGEMVDSTSSMARDLFHISHKGYFTQAELVTLTTKLTETDLFSGKMKTETTNLLWKALLQNILFPPERRLKGEVNDRLSMEQFDILRSEFAIWIKTQVVLNDIFNNNQETSYTPNELLKILKEKVLKSQNDPELKTGLEGVFSLLEGPIAFTWDSEDHLEISNRVEWKYRLNALFQANLTRSLTRLLLRSFSSEPTLNRVNKCEIQGAFDLLAGVFRDLNIFDPQKDFINSRFMEANIFMTRANGDKYMDFNEMGELINVIFSGLRVNSKLESSLRNICKVSKTADGKDFVTFKCMSEHHYVMVRKFMTQLPDFKAYVEKLASKDKGESTVMRDFEDLTYEESTDPNDDTPEDPQTPPTDPRKGPRPGFVTWNGVFRQTLKATGWKPNKGLGDVKEESVLLSEALYYPFIVQYTELLYARFDYTKNGYLQSFEAKKAFPTFRPILRDLASDQIKKGLIGQGDLLSVFTYILRYKEEPGIGSIFRWLSWRNNDSKWDKEVWVGRTDIAQILGLIADKTKDSDGGAAPVCK